MTKYQIRKEKKLQRNMLPFEDRIVLDKAINEQLFLTTEYQKCSCLLTYVSFGSEVDTWEIIHRALFDGKKVYIPRVEEAAMEFIEIDTLEGLTSSKFGVPEPPYIEEKRFIDWNRDADISTTKLMLLPGLAFDYSGNRIGYGAGYYDRYLSKYPKEYFYKIALAYDFQVVEQIAAEEYDIKADAIVTPRKRIQCDTASIII